MRHRLLVKIVAAVALATFLLLPWGARADAIARNGEEWVRITALPCNAPAMVAVLPDENERLTYRAGTARMRGKDYLMCWRPGPGYQTIELKYEDGDPGSLPVRELQPIREPRRT